MSPALFAVALPNDWGLLDTFRLGASPVLFMMTQQKLHVNRSGAQLGPLYKRVLVGNIRHVSIR